MKRILAIALALIALAVPVFAQNTNSTSGNVAVTQPGLPLYYTTPISATAAVNNQTTLTIPAAAGLYNYVCILTFTAAQDNTSAANTSQVTTATNFNSFALKYSLEATANKTLVIPILTGNPATGCVKSTAPGTATTFVSPVAIANTSFTWYATYFQAP